MIAAYRDNGYWRQIWHVCSSLLKLGRLRCFPPKGFVGLVSGSSPAIAARLCRLKSIRLSPSHSTPGARLWRLTYVWEICPPQPRRISGVSSGPSGKRWGAGGAGISMIQTTLKF